MSGAQLPPTAPGRRQFAIGLIAVMLGALMSRAFYLHILDQDHLQAQGEKRHLRTQALPAARGIIYDRNGEPLAVSTRVETVNGEPEELVLQREQLPRLARLVGWDSAELTEELERRACRKEGSKHIFLKRNANPTLVRRVEALGIEGIFTEPGERRFYPAAEIPANIVGFTDLNGKGLEGVEYVYNQRLAGSAGSERVIRDNHKRTVERVEIVEEARNGEDLYLSIDRRLQYLAMRALEKSVRNNGARGGSVVVLDATTGELLALANQPTFNPNDNKDWIVDHYRNRAVTDTFEPGSTIKPFTIAAAIDSGRFTEQDLIDTTPGYMMLAGYRISDARNYGRIDMATIIQKSSNVGAAKVAMELKAEQLHHMLTQVGFGERTSSAAPGEEYPFPGEAKGHLKPYREWQRVEQATMSYGYGFSATALQLAKAYAVLADHGRMHPIRLLRLEPGSEVPTTQVITLETARIVQGMLESVVAAGGTGTGAQVPGYRIAGKTGTVRKAHDGGYEEERYRALFAGFAPASNPRIVVVVVLDEPSGHYYYGGEVAAPIFAEVTAGALRLLDIPPDRPLELLRMASAGGKS